MMQITELELAGVFLIQAQAVADERGYFLRTWSQPEFAEAGLKTDWLYGAAAYNQHQGTLRGMHYQREPYGESKLVRCIRGAVYDVVIDLRPASKTYLQHLALELSADNQLALYIPPECAHGYQSLTDESELSYSICGDYFPAAAAGLRWNDPCFKLAWPLDVTVISERDASYPDYIPEVSHSTPSVRNRK